MDNKDILRLENVSKFYKSANNVALGIRKVNVSFRMGEFVIITGASGSGKSTLLNVLSGMTSYEEGVMYINGEDSSYFGHDEYEKYRKDYIACIFQNYNIIDSYSVYENIELALIAKGVKKEDRKPVILDIAKKVGINHRLKNKVTKLSGGEKQRVAIARALVSDAPILVCDEITGNLDHDTSIEIVKLLHSLSEDKLVLMVTHDPEEVMQYATRVISMHDGVIANDKELKEVRNIEEIKIKETHNISKVEIFKLALRSFKNVPKKSIFLFLIILVATIFIGFACASVGNSNNALGQSEIYYFNSGVNYDKRRIVVKRQDETSLTQADYDTFTNNSNVNALIKNDKLIDTNVNINVIDSEGNYLFYSSTFIMPISMITSKDLIAGRMPENKNEIIIQSSQANYESFKSALNLDATIGNNSQFKAKIVGFIISDDSLSTIIYLHEDYCNIYSELSQIKAKEVVLKGYTRPELYVKDSTLANNSVMTCSPKGWYDSDSFTYDTLSYLEGKETKEIKNINYSHFEYEDDYTQLRSHNPDFFNLFDELGYSYIYLLSEDIYNTLLASNPLQASLYVNNTKKVDETCTELINSGYIAINLYYEQTNDSGEILNAILSVLLYFYCLLLTAVVYLLAYLSLKKVIYSERKDLLIMRSLGISSKIATSQIYIKLIGISLITYLMFIGFSLGIRVNYFPSYHPLYAIAHMRVVDMVYTFLLMMFMTFFLSRKFAKNIFNANIASKDKEERLS